MRPMPGNLGGRMVQNFTRRGYVVDVIPSVAPRRANSTAFPVSSTIFFSSRTANSREGQVCTWLCPEGRLAVGVLSLFLPPTSGGDAMDDAALIENEDLWSAQRAREVRGEVLTGPERRRRWSLEEKLRILAQSVAPGSSASLVCRLPGISSGQLYTWRQKFRTGELTGLAPVTLAPLVGQLPAAAAPVDPMWTLPVADQSAGGTIEVELPSGVKLRLMGAVDEAALHRVDRQRVVVTVVLKKLSL
jgi:transposase